ncbi:MAG: porin [Melioribacteraceae bacterium]
MKKFILLLLVLVFTTQIYSQGKTPYKAPTFKVWVMGDFHMDDTENLVPASGFQMRAARLIFSGKLDNGFGYHAMGDFFDQGNARPVLMQAWISYDASNYAQFRMGQFKYPFGTEAYGPLVKWKFINPSFVTGKLVKKLGMEGSIFRDIGIQAAGTAKFSKDFSLGYKAMIMNGNGANTIENNDAKDIVGQATFKLPYNISLLGSFFAGQTSLIGDASTTDVDENAIALTGQIYTKKYSAKFEYITSTKKLPTKDFVSAGFFGHATYMITKQIEAGVRYDNFDANTDVENDLLNRTTIMAAYYFNGINRISLNYELRNNEKNDKWGNLLTVQFQAAL